MPKMLRFPQIAAQVGTPFYLYSSATLLRHFKLFDEALAMEWIT